MTCYRSAFPVRWAGYCAAVMLGLALPGCTKVKLPRSDSTPPTLVWTVFNHATNEQAEHSGSPTLTAKRGDQYRVTLKANDPQGVKYIQINPDLGSGEIAWKCTSGNLAQSKTATLAPMTQNLSPDSNNMVLTSIFLITDLDLTLDCQSGWSLDSGSAHLTGRASNYFGGVTTGVITFDVTQ